MLKTNVSYRKDYKCSNNYSLRRIKTAQVVIFYLGAYILISKYFYLVLQPKTRPKKGQTKPKEGQTKPKKGQTKPKRGLSKLHQGHVLATRGFWIQS